MPLDLAAARVAFAQTLFGDAVTVQRTGQTITGAVSYQPLQADRSGVVRVLKGAYKLQCRVDADVRLDDVLTFGAATFRIVDAPPVTALSLARVCGMEAL